MKPNRRFTFVYGVALGVLAGSEGLAVARNREGETLTQHWKWIDQEAHKRGSLSALWHAGNFIAAAWFVYHFLCVHRKAFHV